MTDDRLLLDLPEVARRLGVSIRTVKRLVEGGELVTVGIRRRRLVRVCDLTDFVGALGNENDREQVRLAVSPGGRDHGHGRAHSG